ncbi:MAG: hypothetical protein CM15mP50_5130 [Rhodobacterales bacterium]|nr:MAG: hypothetical protein CM15mP50_5130 [Rhodobacterales bacterium]
MMLIGATFAMRYTKFNQAGLLILTSVLVGFILFSLERIAVTLGEAQQIPILLAPLWPSHNWYFSIHGVITSP